MSDPTSPLLLGPLLRYVDETSASVWVETRGPRTVSVTRGATTSSACCGVSMPCAWRGPGRWARIRS